MLRTEGDVRRLVREAAEDDVRDGGRWLEIQVDPSGYGARFGGITAFTDLVLDAVREASQATGLGMAVVIAANRTRHPLDARTLARLAAQYAGRGVVGLRALQRRATRQHGRLRRGVLDRRAGRSRRWSRTAASLRGPEHIGTCLDALHADRLGHGVRSAEDPALLDRIVAAGVALEVCPVSNVALGVYSDLTSVPLPTLLAAGATVALGADDPLLFGSRLAGQYATMRAAHDLSDATLAEPGPDVGARLPRPRGRPHRRAAGDRRVGRRRSGHGGAMTDRPDEPEQQGWPQYQPQQPYQPEAPVAAVVPARAPTRLRLRLPARDPRRRDHLDGARHHRPGLLAARVHVLRHHPAWMLTAPFAWVIGARAKREIDAQPGRYTNRGSAEAGVVMGIIGTVLGVLAVAAVVLFFGLLAYSVPDPVVGTNVWSPRADRVTRN